MTVKFIFSPERKTHQFIQEALEILQGKRRCEKESGLIPAAESSHRKRKIYIWVSFVYCSIELTYQPHITDTLSMTISKESGMRRDTCGMSKVEFEPSG